MYGSSLRLVTRTPREARIAASDAAAMAFPSEETTPPVTKTNFVIGCFGKLHILPEHPRRTQAWRRDRRRYRFISASRGGNGPFIARASARECRSPAARPDK